MANVETYEDVHSVFYVEEGIGNYSHVNLYKRLEVQQYMEPSSLHRQARLNALPAPRSRNDVMSHLSDSADRDYPIFRPTTVATLILDGATGGLEVWCCGHPAAGDAPPVYRWNLHSFFSQPGEGGIVLYT